MGNFLQNHPNMRRGVVSVAAIGAMVGPVACKSDQASCGDIKVNSQYANGQVPDRYEGARDYLVSSEREQKLHDFAACQVKKLLEANEADPDRVGLIFNPDAVDPKRPPASRRIGTPGQEGWGFITNIFGGGKGSVLASARVFMGADGQVQLQQGVQALSVAEYKDDFPKEGDTQASIDFKVSKKSYNFACLWEVKPPAQGGHVGENEVTSVELRKYDQHGESPFGDWVDVVQTCEQGEALAVTTRQQLEGTDTQVTATVTSLINKIA